MKQKTVKYTFEIVKSIHNGEFYWRVTHKNGREIARSSETYKRRGGAARGLDYLIMAISEVDYNIRDKAD
jgi:uncharacterized protein YegP (UPF0339 family)